VRDVRCCFRRTAAHDFDVHGAHWRTGSPLYSDNLKRKRRRTLISGLCRLSSTAPQLGASLAVAWQVETHDATLL
jgi:hypothetical protein